MVKWFRLTKNQYFGFFAFGLVLFALQELPYIITPLIPLTSNPLMETTDKSLFLSIIEKMLCVTCVFVMLFLVRSDGKPFSFSNPNQKAFFSLAMLALAGYFVGWIFYFSGYQSLPLILCLLVAMPPIYYALIGLWRRNYLLVVLSGLFLFAHMLNVWHNLKLG